MAAGGGSITYRIFRTFDFDDGSDQTFCEKLKMDDDEKPKGMGKVIQIDKARIRDHLGVLFHLLILVAGAGFEPATFRL